MSRPPTPCLPQGSEDVGARDEPDEPGHDAEGCIQAFPAVVAWLVPAMTRGRKSYFLLAASRFFLLARNFRRSARSLAFFFRQEMHLQPTALMKQSKYPRP